MTNIQGNRSTILKLYEAVNGPVSTPSVKKYAETTQTLYKNKNTTLGSKNAPGEKEIFVSSEAYQQMLSGARLYATVNRQDFMIGDEIKIYENSTKNRFMYKTILGIETSIDNPGLKPGYIIISFER